MEEQITDKMYMGEPVLDNRPLTDEVLQELGFEYIKTELGNPHYDMTIGSVNLFASHSTNQWCVDIGADGNIWKTVGSVKMLIEALKGEK